MNYVLGLAIGVTMSIQGLFDGVLGKMVGIWTTVLCITVINIVGLIIMYAIKPYRFSVNEIVGSPLYLYLGGGILGLLIMGGLVYVFPGVGACYTTVTVFVGQAIASYMIDRMGLLDMPQRKFDISSIVGFFLIGIGGVLLKGR